MSWSIKSLGTVMLLFACSIVNAGFYVGAGLGPDSVDFYQRTHARGTVYLDYPPNFDAYNKTHLAGNGVFGTIFAGFGQLFLHDKKFYIGAEANANISSVKYTAYNHEYIHTSFQDSFIKIKNSYGISVLPGFQYTPDTLFYGRLGIAIGKIQRGNNQVFDPSTDFSKSQNAFRYGLGMKRKLTDHLDIRMDYSRINYHGIQNNFNNPYVIVNRKLIPGQQLLEFGMVYNFS